MLRTGFNNFLLLAREQLIFEFFSINTTFVKEIIMLLTGVFCTSNYFFEPQMFTK